MLGVLKVRVINSNTANFIRNGTTWMGDSEGYKAGQPIASIKDEYGRAQDVFLLNSMQMEDILSRMPMSKSPIEAGLREQFLMDIAQAWLRSQKGK